MQLSSLHRLTRPACSSSAQDAAPPARLSLTTAPRAHRASPGLQQGHSSQPCSSCSPTLLRAGTSRRARALVVSAFGSAFGSQIGSKPNVSVFSATATASQERPTSAPADRPVHSPPSTSGIPQPSPPTFIKTNGRIVAIGDLHGDWNKAVESFRMAGLVKITSEGELVWTGQDTIVVQLGDVLDRGDNEITIVRLLRGLDIQARKEGGAVYMLHGNHETLNVCGDFRYVTPGAFRESALFAGLYQNELHKLDQPDWQLLARVRLAVYKPGGPMAMELSKNPTVLVINDTVFAHGGLLPIHVNYGLEKLNAEVAAWMRADSTPDGGKAAPPFLAMGDGSSVVWNRTLSRENFQTPYDRVHACSALKQTLSRLGVRRLVVGHTPQLSGANCECEGSVWRIDVGMSGGVLNSPVQVIEIVNDQEGNSVVRVLPEGGYSSSLDEDDGLEL